MSNTSNIVINEYMNTNTNQETGEERSGVRTEDICSQYCNCVEVVSPGSQADTTQTEHQRLINTSETPTTIIGYILSQSWAEQAVFTITI